MTYTFSMSYVISTEATEALAQVASGEISFILNNFKRFLRSAPPCVVTPVEMNEMRKL